MSVTSDYLAWVLDQLAELGPVTTRRMFGAAGLYRDGVFFGLVDDDVTYFRVDDESRLDYVERGMEPFRPTPDQVSSSYFAVPEDVLESPDELAEWARKAVSAARAVRRRKAVTRPR